MNFYRCFVFEEIKIVENVFDDLPHALLKDFVIFIFLKVHIHVHSLIVKLDWTPGMFLPVADLTFLFNNLGGCFSEENHFCRPLARKIISFKSFDQRSTYLFPSYPVIMSRKTHIALKSKVSTVQMSTTLHVTLHESNQIKKSLNLHNLIRSPVKNGHGTSVA